MIKKHLTALIDIKLIVILVVIIAISAILTMIFSDQIKEFTTKYKKKFYSYILSFVLMYSLVAFLGHNKLFNELSDEFLFYQIASLLFGIMHAYLYRRYFEEFNLKSVSNELIFAFLIMLYSSVLFIIIYTALNGIYFTFLMSSHFLIFIVPTGINIVFNYMMLIPPRKFITWEPKTPYAPIESHEMEDILLITLLIRKEESNEESNEEYASIRAQAPVKVDFGRLFYLTLTGYNKYNPEDQIELLQPSGESYNWVFYLQPKWNEKTKYVDAGYYIGLNGITENSVVICQREIEKNEKPKKEKNPDQKVYGIESHNEAVEKKKLKELKEPETVDENIK